MTVALLFVGVEVTVSNLGTNCVIIKVVKRYITLEMQYRICDISGTRNALVPNRSNSLPYVAFHYMIVALFQQGQNGPDFGMGKN